MKAVATESWTQSTATKAIHSAMKIDDATDAISHAAKARLPSISPTASSLFVWYSIELIEARLSLRLRLSTGLLFETKPKDLSDQLKCQPFAVRVGNNCKDAGFVLTGCERWSVENKTVPIVCRAFSASNVGTKFSGVFISNKLTVYIQLNFDTRPGLRFVDYPAAHRLAIRHVQHAPQIRIRISKVETNCNGGHQ